MPASLLAPGPCLINAENCFREIEEQIQAAMTSSAFVFQTPPSASLGLPTHAPCPYPHGVSSKLLVHSPASGPPLDWKLWLWGPSSSGEVCSASPMHAPTCSSYPPCPLWSTPPTLPAAAASMLSNPSASVQPTKD
eukprot:1159201-Pelagomonas_calceolata.AAC.17